ncbi:MAG: hypothetical protein SVR08_17570 [Spirochaetota bacterium]|nr:hypothetical protein [Spirochaetota bacterium]
MNIQNISGVDVIPEGFASNTEISNEISTPEKTEIPKTSSNYENKGQIIDTTA